MSLPQHDGHETAFHESGHALIDHLAGIKLGYVEIVRTKADSRTKGGWSFRSRYRSQRCWMCT
jgi:hypothetical protein